MFNKLVKKYESKLYFIFRVFVGLLFFQHGAQKILGWFGAEAQQLFSLMGLAGVIEIVAGLVIALGLFTRVAAAISAVLMLVAYGMAHAPKGIVPIMNKGELALLYFAAFLPLIIYGAKNWSLEKALFGKER